MSLIYLNGRFVPEEQATVSVFDHGFLYGDGVFEGIRAYEGRVFRLEDHVKRLFDSARAIMLNIPITEEQMCEVIKETLRMNNLKNAYIRPIVSRGYGDLGLDPNNCKTTTVVVIAVEWGPCTETSTRKALRQSASASGETLRIACLPTSRASII